MNFTSQICTNRKQSERLLALGLKKENADMCLHGTIDMSITQPFSNLVKIVSYPIIPAWSLHRLIEMMPSFIDIGEHSYMFSIIQGKLFSYGSDIVGNAFLYGKGSVYESAIYTIEWLIKGGYFNKEYLEE
jgi:hypothetical protein